MFALSGWRRFYLLTFIGFLCGLTVPLSAKAAPSTCATSNTVVGKGVKIARTCTASADPSFDTFDTYYRVVAELTPGQGFADQATFKKESTQGKVFSGLLSSLTSAKKALAVDIGITVSQGTSHYPARSLLYFQKINENEWRSYIRGDARSLFHRLNNALPFTVAVTYSYSNTSSVDLSAGTTLLQSVGVSLVTPAVQPILAAANSITQSIVRASNVVSESGYEFTLSPAVLRNVSNEFQIIDPATGGVIATVRLRLEGSRSLFGIPREHADVAQSLPSGVIALPSLNGLSQQIATGQAQNWNLVNGALAATSLESIPLGREPTPSEISSFCSSMSTGLSSSYALSTFDNLLVRAQLVDTVTKPVQAKINPFKFCFSSSEVALITRHLGIDADFSPVVTDLGPLRSFEGLVGLSCWLTGKEGDVCGARASQKAALSALLADRISVASLEGVVAPSLFANLPADRLITRDDFLDRFLAKFLRFYDISSLAGIAHLQETQDGPALRLVAESEASGKLRRLGIQRF